MNFLTLSYNCVTISFLPEIWFWGPTHPTFLYKVTLLELFFELFPKEYISHYEEVKVLNVMFIEFLFQYRSIMRYLLSLPSTV